MTSKKEENESKLQSEEGKEEHPKDKALESLGKNEVKQLEGEEPSKLEYFSKDEMIQNLAKSEVELKALKEKYDKVEQEKNSWKNKYTRLQAEFENAEKRWNKNRQNLRLEYTASIIKSLLPLYDSFKKALSDDNNENKILKGFYDQFMNILKSYKAEPFETKTNDPFDYNYHEALSSIERADLPNNTIVDVVQDGWKLDKEVIRYSKVILSKEPKPPEPESAKEEQTEEIEDVQSETISKENVGKEKKTSHNSEKEKPKPEDDYIG